MANMSTAKQRHLYSRVASLEQDEDDGQQLGLDKEGVPVKAVALATLLLLSGIALLSASVMHWLGFIHIQEGADVGFLTLGLLTFTPGAYATCIAYGAWRGYPGYSYKTLTT